MDRGGGLGVGRAVRASSLGGLGFARLMEEEERGGIGWLHVLEGGGGGQGGVFCVGDCEVHCCYFRVYCQLCSLKIRRGVRASLKEGELREEGRGSTVGDIDDHPPLHHRHGIIACNNITVFPRAPLPYQNPPTSTFFPSLLTSLHELPILHRLPPHQHRRPPKQTTTPD